MTIETTTELRERLARLRRGLARDTTGRTAELERGIARVETEIKRREAILAADERRTR